MSLSQAPTLKLEGRSGCRLEVLNTGGVFSVKKFSKERDYNARLLLQAKKQQQYFKQSTSADFKTPEVLNQSAATASLTWFEMPYLHGQPYSEFLERCSIADVYKVANKFSFYFQRGFNDAVVHPVDESIFLAKVDALEFSFAHRKDVNKNLIAWSLDYLKHLPDRHIPLAPCHGDFTFSNMLFCDDGIYLVDFLDSFVESPLIDLVKFRQDTFFYWSVLIEHLPGSRASKIIQIFNYLDQYIMQQVDHNKFVKTWYTYLQVFNLLRILPYVYEPEEIDFVEHGIQRLISKP